jgi:hypothetical protein
MKKIINGRRFDTATAILIGETSSGAGYDWYEERLFKTQRSGAYFLTGKGHARSRYATNLGGGSWGPGDALTPMTRDEAFAWAQENLSADLVEREFGDVIEDA